GPPVVIDSILQAVLRIDVHFGRRFEGTAQQFSRGFLAVSGFVPAVEILPTQPDDHSRRCKRKQNPQRGCKRDHNTGEPRTHSGRILTAVPYATISLILLPMSPLSKRIITMASAPIAWAFWTIRSSACFRASSIIWVY